MKDLFIIFFKMVLFIIVDVRFNSCIFYESEVIQVSLILF